MLTFALLGSLFNLIESRMRIGDWVTMIFIGWLIVPIYAVGFVVYNIMRGLDHSYEKIRENW